MSPQVNPAGGSRGATRVVGVILAAGRSSRMGDQHKVLLPVAGVSMVRRVVDAAMASQLCSTTVVTGASAAEVVSELRGCDVTLINNPDYGRGIASSLSRGISSLASDVQGAMILLADMPFITAEGIDRLLAAFDPRVERNIVVPERDGRRGNPIIWPAQYFPRIEALTGDLGARGLLDEFAGNVRLVPVSDRTNFFDIDTPAELEAANTVATGLSGDPRL